MNYNRRGILTQVLGYNESYNKPGLFYKKLENNAILYVDLREISFSHGSVYFGFGNNNTRIKTNELVRKEVSLLEKHNLYGGSTITPVPWNEWEYYNIYGDNKCEFCKKELGISNNFCSKNCESLERERFDFWENHCKLCFRRKTSNVDFSKWNVKVEKVKLIDHHISYFPEDKERICQNCHALITQNKLFFDSWIQYSVNDVKKFYNILE
tara:strand:+ start:46 stop:678 length:633 start_codon:yes stop_codon:yes gene_type:complete